jgi:diguanylate cyclase (GGDEF)-like protein
MTSSAKHIATDSTSGNQLPKLLYSIEAFSFSLASHITWLIVAPIVIFNLRANSIFIWLVGSFIAIGNLILVRYMAKIYPTKSGGIPGYMASFYSKNSIISKYGGLSYFLGWAVIPAMCTILLSTFTSHIFNFPIDPILAKCFQIFFIILISSIGFSSTKLISIFHTILTIPSIIASLLLSTLSIILILATNQNHAPLSFEGLNVFLTKDFFQYFFLSTFIFLTGDIACSFTADSLDSSKTIKTIKWSIIFLPVAYFLISFLLLLINGGGQTSDLYTSTLEISTKYFGNIGLFLITIWVVSSLFLLCSTVISHAPRILFQLSKDKQISHIFNHVSRRGGLKVATIATILTSVFFIFIDDITTLLIVATAPYLISYILFHFGVSQNAKNNPWFITLIAYLIIPIELLSLFIGGIFQNPILTFLGLLLPIALILIDKIIATGDDYLLTKSQKYISVIPNFKKIDNSTLIFSQIILLLILEIVSISGTWFILLYTQNISFLYKLDHLAFILVFSCFSTISVASSTVFSQIQNLDETRKQLALANLALSDDIEKLDLAESAIFMLSIKDNLTSLGNRKLLVSSLNKNLKRIKKNPKLELGILSININRFKSINDSLGYKIGDELLKAVASRIEKTISKKFEIYRSGGDEFAVIIPVLKEQIKLEEVAQDIITSFTFPFIIKGKQLFITASIGINIIDITKVTVDSILSETNIALLEAKKVGKNTYSYFDKIQYEKVMSLLNLETNLPGAIKNKEFELFYQPIIHLESNTIAGYETLVRWANGSKLLPPSSFIPLAEETDLVVPLTWQILEKACFDVRELQIKFNNDRLRVNVNFSLKQFFEPDLVKRIVEIAKKAEIAVSCIKIEITESMLQDSEDLKYVMNELSDNGIRLNLDDFGTGYSSLGYLNTLPISALKIDKSFIKALNPKSLEITQAMINLATNIGASTIVEGIETEEQLIIVKNMGANFGQGFYFCKAVPFDQILDFVYPEPFIFLQKK